MKGINKAILVGYASKDPEIRHTKEGTTIATFSLPTSVKYKDKRTGELVENTNWHQCVGFGKTGELIEQYLKKGMKVYIEGAIDYQEYEKDGAKRYITKITIKDFVILSSINEINHNSNSQEKQKSTGQSKHQTPSEFTEELNDPIPF